MSLSTLLLFHAILLLSPHYSRVLWLPIERATYTESRNLDLVIDY